MVGVFNMRSADNNMSPLCGLINDQNKILLI